MKISLSFLLFSLPFLLNAQTGAQTTGIHFENLSGWNAVKEKAKQENKYIFVDCYATWCGPCKKMDKDVYTIDSIGQFFNSNFLSIKVQVDSSAKDNEEIQKWYTDAKAIQREYKITSLPTFLFFSPEGKLVHKGIGYQFPSAFSSLARNATNPQKQYFTLLEAFQRSKLAYTDMPELTNTALSNQDRMIADTISKVYVNGYLLKQKEAELYTKINLGIIANTIRTSHDKGFDLFYSHAEKVDAIMNEKNFSQHIVDFIVEKEEINTQLYTNGKPSTDNPDWEAIHRRVKKKYNTEYADRTVLWAKIKWLERKREWSEYCKNVILKVEKYGPYLKIFPTANFPTNYVLNASAWDIFTHSTNSEDLKKALEWSATAITDSKPDASYFDTYANLLHKLGRDKEAIPYEEKATALDPSDKVIAENLARIKKGEPTWPSK
ncbi:MAG TPA: thioredoxin fold domain-containing protein [Puia sp.]|jgi:thioredoxin-related protein